MAQVTIHIAGDDSRWQAAHNRMLADMQKALDRAAKAGQQSRKLSEEEIAAIKKKAEEERAFQDLQKRATKVIGEVATAHQAYAASVKDALEMKKKGLITEDQYNRKLAQLKGELRDASGETARLRAAEAEEDRAKVKAIATTQRYMTTLEKLEAELKDVKQQYDAGRVSIQTVERAQKRLNDAQEEMNKNGFQKASEGVENYLSKVATVAGTIGIITSAWNDARQAQEDAVNSLKAKGDSERSLVQIATDAKDLQSMTTLAAELSTAHGVPVETINKAIFAGRSEGFSDAVPEIIASHQVIDPEAALSVAGKTPVLFNGAVSPLEAVSMTLKAGEPSNMDFEDIAANLPKVAEGGSLAKASVEESMATLAVMSSRFASGETDADRIRAFAVKVGTDTGSVDEEFDDKLKREQERAANAAKQLRAKEERVADLQAKLDSGRVSRTGKTEVEKDLARANRDVEEFDREKLKVVEPKRTKPTRESLAGMGIVKAVEKLDAMAPEQRADFLGDSQELNVAYALLSQDLQKIKEQTEALKKERAEFAAGGGALREKRAIAQADPRMQARLKILQSEQKLEIEKEQANAIEGADRIATENTVKASTETQNLGMFERMINNRIVAPVMADIGVSNETAARAPMLTLPFSPRRAFGLAVDMVHGYMGDADSRKRLNAAAGRPDDFLWPGMSAPQQPSAEVNVQGGKEMLEAARLMNQAAANMNRPQSYANAARVQAAKAN